MPTPSQWPRWTAAPVVLGLHSPSVGARPLRYARKRPHIATQPSATYHRELRKLQLTRSLLPCTTRMFRYPSNRCVFCPLRTTKMSDATVWVQPSPCSVWPPIEYEYLRTFRQMSVAIMLQIERCSLLALLISRTYNRTSPFEISHSHGVSVNRILLVRQAHYSAMLMNTASGSTTV